MASENYWFLKGNPDGETDSQSIAVWAGVIVMKRRVVQARLCNVHIPENEVWQRWRDQSHLEGNLCFNHCQVNWKQCTLHLSRYLFEYLKFIAVQTQIQSTKSIKRSKWKLLSKSNTSNNQFSTFACWVLYLVPVGRQADRPGVRCGQRRRSSYRPNTELH